MEGFDDMAGIKDILAAAKPKLDSVKASLGTFSKDHPVLHTALQYGSIGAGAAATAALIRELRSAMDEREKEKRRNKVEIEPGTIVLRVPRSRLRKTDKYASAKCPGCHETVAAVDAPSDTVVDVRKNQAAPKGVQRDVRGRFVSKGLVRVNPSEKKGEYSDTGVGARTAEILAAVTAAAGGYYGVEKLRQYLEQRRLRKQIAAAQNEYVGLLDGGKQASAEDGFASLVYSVLPFPPMSKEAGFGDFLRNVGNQSKNVTAAGLATLIAMTLGSGYLTKRILEQKFDPPEEEDEPVKVNRIMFKPYDDDDAKVASAPFEITHEQALATLGICMGAMSPESLALEKGAADYSFLDKIMSTDKGRQWMLDAYASGKGLSRPGFRQDELPGLSAMDKLKYSKTLIGMKRNPSRHMPMVERHVMSYVRSDPKSWFALIGRDRNRDLVDRVAGDTFDKYMANGGLGPISKIPGLNSLVGGAGKKWLTGTESGNKAVMNMLARQLGVGRQKAAGALDVLGKMHQMSADRKILKDKTNKDLEAKLDAILDRMAGAKRKAKKRAPTVDVSADDDETAEYVVRNGAGIARALDALQRKGLVE